MAQQDLHLRRRHNAYFFRRRLPSPIASAVGRSEINMSLRTGQLSLARQRAARIRVACDMAIEGFLMGRFSRTDRFDSVVWDYYNIVSKAVEDIRTGEGLHEPGAVDQYFFDESLKADAALGLRDISFISPDARAGLAARGLELDPASDEFQALALDMALARRRVEAEHYGPGPQNPRQSLSDEEFAALERRFAPRRVVATEAPAKQEEPKQSARPRLAEAARTYIRDVEIGGKVEQKTLAERRRDIGLFAEFVGEAASIDELNRANVRDFRNLLMRLAPRFRLAKENHDRSLEELAEANASGQTLSPASINKILSNLSVFVDWAVIECGIGPVKISDFRLDNTLAIDEDRRSPFSPQQLKTIFTAPYFTGCASEDEWWAPGQVSLRGTGRYWLMVIGLLTGARAEELAGLILEDIDLDRRLIRIAPNVHRPRLKNAVSMRWVPIHPLLAELGFDQFVASRAGLPTDRLFTDIVSAPGKPHSAAFSKFFGRFLDRLGLEDSSLVFHSFRSTFITRAEARLVSNEILDRLVGHAGSHSDSRKNYRGTTPVEPASFEPFHTAMMSMDLGVDLSHLRVDYPARTPSHFPIATEKLHPFEVSNQ